MRGLSGDRGDVILGWFTKIAIILAIVGVIGFEATSIAVAHVQTQDLAKSAARAGSKEWQRSRDVQQAYQAAEAVALGDGGTIAPEEFVIAEDSSVTVTVQKEANTLVLYRIGPAKDWTIIREKAQARFIA